MDDTDYEALYDELVEIICGSKMVAPVPTLHDLKRDAERYRWLREHSTQPSESWSTHSDPESLDRAVDEAMDSKPK